MTDDLTEALAEATDRTPEDIEAEAEQINLLPPGEALLVSHVAAGTADQPQRLVFTDDPADDALERVSTRYMAFEDDPRIRVER